MWRLVIECIAAANFCEANPSPATPDMRTEYATHAECDRALMSLVKGFRPTQGAWTMNCVKRG